MFQIIERADAAITTTTAAAAKAAKAAAAIAVVDCSRSCSGSKIVPMMMMGVWSKGGH